MGRAGLLVLELRAGRAAAGGPPGGSVSPGNKAIRSSSGIREVRLVHAALLSPQVISSVAEGGGEPHKLGEDAGVLLLGANDQMLPHL